MDEQKHDAAGELRERRTAAGLLQYILGRQFVLATESSVASERPSL